MLASAWIVDAGEDNELAGNVFKHSIIAVV